MSYQMQQSIHAGRLNILILRISMLNVSQQSFETVEYAVLAKQHVEFRLAPDVWGIYVSCEWTVEFTDHTDLDADCFSAELRNCRICCPSRSACGMLHCIASMSFLLMA